MISMQYKIGEFVIHKKHGVGEIIDIDAYTGGYNSQAAWSTGYLSGMNAAVEK